MLKKKVTVLVAQSCLTLCVSMDYIARQVPLSIGFSRQEYWSELPFPSPGVFLTQLSNSGLLHCRQTLDHLSHQRSHTYAYTHAYTHTIQTYILLYISVQFSSVAQSCSTLCNPMNRSMPGLPVHHQLPEFTQTHVH